ncbi:MAG: CBS domain-containing protein [Bacteroidales bacterium]
MIELKKTKVSDCMLPQDQIVLANLHSSVDTLKQKFIDSGFSKIPIYDTDPNKVIGYVHAYDLFKKPKEIAKLIRPIYAVSSTMPINTALTDMIAKHISISVVFDETQKLLGLLTLEDLMEEIFGEIEDEFDR